MLKLPSSRRHVQSLELMIHEGSYATHAIWKLAQDASGRLNSVGLPHSETFNV